MNNSISAVSPSFGMAWTRDVGKLANQANYLNTEDLKLLTECVQKAKRELANTTCADLHTTTNSKGELVNRIQCKLAQIKDNGEVGLVGGYSREYYGLGNFDEAINETLRLEKVHSDIYAAKKAYAEALM